MTINKDNYEEYFLLFADNELAEKEKNMVEDFVRQNTELEEEFLSIRQSVLQPENEIKLADKSGLFRHSKMPISLANYPEFFILYIDDELTGVERSETELFMVQNPSLQKEFALFQKTKLLPGDTIVFTNKQRLLKRESKVKTFPFAWWKALAAAVLTAIGLWIGIDLLKEEEAGAPVIVKSYQGGKPGYGLPVSIDTANIKKAVVIKERKSSNYAEKRIVKNTAGKVPVEAMDPGILRVITRADNVPKISNAPKKIVPEKSALNNEEEPLNADTNLDNENHHKKNVDGEVQQDLLVQEKTPEMPQALPASYVSAENENSSNYAFYNITEEKFNKSKIGGFFRKVKRVIGRKISPLNNSKDQREMVDN